MQAGGLWPRRGRTDGSIRLRVTAFLMFSLALKGASTDVAWISGVDALSPTRVLDHAMRTYFGRPSSSMRFSTPTAMCGRPPRCKEKMEDQQLGQVRSCVRPQQMRYA